MGGRTKILMNKKVVGIIFYIIIIMIAGLQLGIIIVGCGVV